MTTFDMNNCLVVRQLLFVQCMRRVLPGTSMPLALAAARSGLAEINDTLILSNCFNWHSDALYTIPLSSTHLSVNAQLQPTLSVIMPFAAEPSPAPTRRLSPQQRVFYVQAW